MEFEEIPGGFAIRQERIGGGDAPIIIYNSPRHEPRRMLAGAGNELLLKFRHFVEQYRLAAMVMISSGMFYVLASCGLYALTLGKRDEFFFMVMWLNVYVEVVRIALIVTELPPPLPLLPSFHGYDLHRIIESDAFHYLYFSFIFLSIDYTMLAIPSLAIITFLQFVVYVTKSIIFIMESLPYGLYPIIVFMAEKSDAALRCVAVFEILLMPTVIAKMLTNQASIFAPYHYYRFLCMRYEAPYNSDTRELFKYMRAKLEDVARDSPKIVGMAIRAVIKIICKLAPGDLAP